MVKKETKKTEKTTKTVTKVTKAKKEEKPIIQADKDIKKLEEKESIHVTTTMIGAIKIKNKMYRLLVGDDNKWYKQVAVGETRFDLLNNTPLVTVWDTEIEPFTKKEFEAYFKK